jgi:hypothetical protein
MKICLRKGRRKGGREGKKRKGRKGREEHGFKRLFNAYLEKNRN